MGGSWSLDRPGRAPTPGESDTRPTDEPAGGRFWNEGTPRGPGRYRLAAVSMPERVEPMMRSWILLLFPVALAGCVTPTELPTDSPPFATLTAYFSN